MVEHFVTGSELLARGTLERYQQPLAVPGTHAGSSATPGDPGQPSAIPEETLVTPEEPF